MLLCKAIRQRGVGLLDVVIVALALPGSPLAPHSVVHSIRSSGRDPAESLELPSLSDAVHAETQQLNTLSPKSAKSSTPPAATDPHEHQKHHLQFKAGNISHAIPFYHSSDEIQAGLRRLAGKGGCPKAQFMLHQEHDSGISLDTVRVLPYGANHSKGKRHVQRVFLLFGEHARELISAELGFFFLRVLCGDTTLQSSKGSDELVTRAAKLLANQHQPMEYMVVVNANPLSRRKVETGAWCLRVNENGVDLNRNWGVHRDAVTDNQRTDPDQNEGPAAFSEPETRILRRIVEAYRPVVFVSIHSGTFMLGTPSAYTATFPKDPVSNGLAMLDVLKPINEQVCNCPYGPVGIAVGYESAGTCLDYIYEKVNVPFAFIWEVYTNDAVDLHSTWKQNGAWLEDPHARARWAGTPVSLEKRSTEVFLQTSNPEESISDILAKKELLARRVRTQLTPEECLQMFNPVDAAEFDRTLHQWSGALLEASENVNLYMPGGPKALSEVAASAAIHAQQERLDQPLKAKLGAIHNRYADLYAKLGLKHHR